MPHTASGITLSSPKVGWCVGAVELTRKGTWRILRTSFYHVPERCTRAAGGGNRETNLCIARQPCDHIRIART